MKRKYLLFAALAIIASLPSGGCAYLNAYDSDPNKRTQQLLVQSENLRQLHEEQSRFWFVNTPSTMSYERLSGYIGP
jgi:hypothetical protein